MATGSCVLALDCGLTATKAAVFDFEGRLLSLSRRPTKVRNRGGSSELDMDEQWTTAAAVIREALQDSARPAAEVACVAVAGHGAGAYLLDEARRPVRPAITSLDGRAAALVADWRARGVDAYTRTRHHLWPGQPVPQLAWLKTHEADAYRRTKSVLGAKDWAVFRLTGEVSADLTDASNSGFMDLSRRAYDVAILEVFGLGETAEWLPPAARSTDLVGRTNRAAEIDTGLAAGTPVAAGLFDVVACALGTGVYDDTKLSLIAGTWNINTAFDRRLVEAAPSVKCSLGADGTTYAYVESSATSAGNLEWFVATFIGDLAGAERYTRVTEAAARVAPAPDLPLFLPFIYPSHLDGGRGAGLVGLRPEHGFAEAARAVLEGICFAHRAHVEILGSSGLARSPAVLSGGASNSRHWASMFADVLGLPVEVADSPEAGALGAAIVAVVAAGIYPSIETAARRMVRSSVVYEPHEGRSDLYRERFERFKTAAQ